MQRKLTLWKRLSEKQEGVDRTTALHQINQLRVPGAGVQWWAVNPSVTSAVKCPEQMSEALACGASLYLAESGQIGCNGRDRNPSRLPTTSCSISVS